MDQIETIVTSIIKFLKTSGQLDLLPQIIHRLEMESAKLKGENTAMVTSSYLLNNQELSEIEKQLFNVFGRKLTIINTVDHEIVGGLVIQVSDKIIDLSLKTYLNDVEEKMKNEKN